MRVKAKEVDGKDGKRRIRFDCPGCGESHVVTVGGDGWGFNENFEQPTLTPSVLVTSGHYIAGHEGDCWCTYNEKHKDNPSPFKCSRCHSFVTNGKIQFLSDCTHELVNQEMDLPLLEMEVTP